ncbi:cardiolipin synthase [Rhabdochromatium marinum]|uniref:cardiolipin synthase n=1 Tax=Rhabdochromatium marinum TaxID=48729 RepID=UPI0019077F49|nr:cardiolipin synthase [Rhabdochromatium marinum]MBK1647406.1 cardiolipin synthase [Rhabdochromatium marinum]
MSDSSLIASLLLLAHFALQVGISMRVMLRPHREPAARMTWIVLIFAVPIIGFIAYLLVGETNIGRRRVARLRQSLARLPAPHQVARSTSRSSPRSNQAAKTITHAIPDEHRHLFRLGASISGFTPFSGNRATLMPDSDASIDAMVADIEAARDHVHLLFYIWLPDRNGRRVAEALMRAAQRGVVCRALADDLGSRTMIRSEHWQRMQAAGVRLARALPIGNPILRVLTGRIDLRNHRKIVVIDDWVTYCGSQNCADAEFLVKAKYAPWVDLMLRFEGPIARQNQYLFASDWMPHVEDDIDQLLHRPLPHGSADQQLPAQVIGTGPTVRWSAMPEVFEALIYSARRELIITTPYYVPDESIQAALCASARRGVRTTIIFPARNDSRIVAAASRSYYAELLAAGVHIFEYPRGLLHTKSLTMDAEVSLIGSANMDRRSFELNYENNILLYDPALSAQLRERQQQYLAVSQPITSEQVSHWSWRRRLWNNTVAMLGPVL